MRRGLQRVEAGRDGGGVDEQRVRVGEDRQPPRLLSIRQLPARGVSDAAGGVGQGVAGQDGGSGGTYAGWTSMCVMYVRSRSASAHCTRACFFDCFSTVLLGHHLSSRKV